MLKRCINVSESEQYDVVVCGGGCAAAMYAAENVDVQLLRKRLAQQGVIL